MHPELLRALSQDRTATWLEAAEEYRKARPVMPRPSVARRFRPRWRAARAPVTAPIGAC